MSTMKQKSGKGLTRTKASAVARAQKPESKNLEQPAVASTRTASLSNGVDKQRQKKKASNPKLAESAKQKTINGTSGIQAKGKQPNRKRKAPKDLDGTKAKKAVAVNLAEEIASAGTVKTDVLSKASTKRQKVLLDLPKLPTVSGVLFVIGDNDVGQLGLGEEVHGKKRPSELDFPVRFVDIAAGGMHSVCLTDKGEVYTFGCNDEGALGRPTEDEEGSEYIPKKVDVPGVVVKVSAGDSHSAALTEDGQVYIWGNFRSGEGPMGLTAQGVKQTVPVQILNNVIVVSISSGSEHLVCLSNEGIVYTCGCGETGQLGRVTERSSKGNGRKGLSSLLVPDSVSMGSKKNVMPVDCIWTGSYSTFLRAKESGAIYAFGLNNYNQLGYENERVRFRPKLIASFTTKSMWQQISGGQHHTLALDGNGKVYSLGRKEYGRLGLGEDCEEKSQPTIIPYLESEKCIDISSGNVVSFSVSEKGHVYSWGMGTNHQLGHGDDEDCHIPKVIEGNLLNSWHVFKVAGGGQHTLLLANRKAVSEQKSSAKE